MPEGEAGALERSGDGAMNKTTSRPSFKKGLSGNPGGRRKDVAEMRDLAREFTTEAIEHLVH
jgi:hypothetical protein